jgi:hypothetical protein
MEDKTEYKTIRLRYSRLLANKDFLPLFVTLKPDNIIECRLSEQTLSDSAKVDKLLLTLSKLFQDIQLLP